VGGPAGRQALALSILGHVHRDVIHEDRRLRLLFGGGSAADRSGIDGSPPVALVPTCARPGPLGSSRMPRFHDFEMTSITGEQVSFDRFRGQVCLVVNVASA
jgi:hypothetical protein